MSEVVKIAREDADHLFSALKIKKAASQTDEWVQKALNSLADNLSEDQIAKVKDADAKETLDKVMTALADDQKIAVGGDEDPEDGEEESETETEDEESEFGDGADEDDEEPAPKKKAGTKASAAKKPAAKKPPAAKKGPGVIDTIIAELRKGTKKASVRKDAIHKVLVKAFPDRDPSSMKATLNAQVPTGLKTEKDIDVGSVPSEGGQGYYIVNLNGWKPRTATK